MIFQPKKFILALLLVFTLFCGLSVSAYAADTETYLYNGVELPALPEWDKETYPYAVLSAYEYVPNGYVIRFSSAPLYYDVARDGITNGDVMKAKIALLHESNRWSVSDSGEFEVGVVLWRDSLWSNCDIFDTDGNLFLAASDPIPVSSKIVPDLISRTYSFTDTTAVSEITLMNLDPLETYKVYWSVYDMDDNLLNHGYSEQIGEITGVETATAYSRIINLKPATTYQLSWNLYTGDEIIPVNSINTVTTLGVSSDNSGDLGGSDNGGDSGNSGDSGSMDGTGSEMGEDDISGTQGDGNTGILMQILNKLSAIFDFLTGDKEVEDTPEQAIKDATSEVTQAVADTIFGENSTIKPTVDTVSDVASIGTLGKSFFTPNVSLGDFLGLFNDTTLIRWFSDETVADLNAVPAISTYRSGQGFSESARIFNEHSQKHFAFAGFGGDD